MSAEKTGRDLKAKVYTWVCFHGPLARITSESVYNCENAKKKATAQLHRLSSSTWVAAVYDGDGRLVATRRNSGLGVWKSATKSSVNK